MIVSSVAFISSLTDIISLSTAEMCASVAGGRFLSVVSKSLAWKNNTVVLKTFSINNDKEGNNGLETPETNIDPEEEELMSNRGVKRKIHK